MVSVQALERVQLKKSQYLSFFRTRTQAQPVLVMVLDRIADESSTISLEYDSSVHFKLGSLFSH